MFSVFLSGLFSVIVVSLVSLVGIFTLSVKIEKLRKVLLYLVSFSAGALFGGAFFHLIPESAEDGFSLSISFFILAGIIGFFAIEKLVQWRHCHIPTCKEHPHSLGIMNLIGDGFHNFIDGLVIAVSYVAGMPLGITTTIAVVLHEIPQEIGDFGVLIHAGFSRKKALLMNFLISLTAVLGYLIGYAFAGSFSHLSYFLIPFTAGGFIYIASSDLIPELKKEQSMKKSVLQLFMILLGIMLMLALKLSD